jgi:hypothetical protein
MIDDKEVALETVKVHGELWYVSERLRDDKEVALEAVKKNEQAIVCVSKRLRDSREFMLACLAIERTPDDVPSVVFYHASDRLRREPEFLYYALQANPLVILAYEEVQRFIVKEHIAERKVAEVLGIDPSQESDNIGPPML